MVSRTKHFADSEVIRLERATGSVYFLSRDTHVLDAADVSLPASMTMARWSSNLVLSNQQSQFKVLRRVLWNLSPERVHKT